MTIDQGVLIFEGFAIVSIYVYIFLVGKDAIQKPSNFK